MINDAFSENKDNTFFKNSTKIFSKVFLYMEKIETVFKIHNDQNFMTDFIVYLIKVIFNVRDSSLTTNANNSSQQNSNNSMNVNNLIHINNISKEPTGSSSLSILFINYFNY